MLLNQLLETYTPQDESELQMKSRLLRFLYHAKTDAFGRELAGTEPDWGHVTGSAWIVNNNGSRVVLVHHAKLGKWVQPGGHCDDESDVTQVALREAREETGLAVLPVQATLFDIDAHRIPEYWNTPEHWHFDARFLLQADDKVAPICSQESRDVRWVELEEALELNPEESIARMVRKTREHFNL